MSKATRLQTASLLSVGFSMLFYGVYTTLEPWVTFPDNVLLIGAPLAGMGAALSLLLIMIHEARTQGKETPTD